MFLALPALQNSQKDTARREVVGQYVSALEELLADNNGKTSYVFAQIPNYLPTNTGFVYEEHSPTGSTGQAPAVILPTTDKVEGVWGALCGADKSASATVPTLFDITAGTANPEGKVLNTSVDGAFAIKLSSGNYYCQDV